MLVLALVPATAAAQVCPDQVVLEKETLRVVTLNVAHGRKDARNQVFLAEESIRSNLLEVAGLMRKAQADVFALQEADAESSWSGKFDHVSLLAEHSGYSCFVHGIHASNRVYDFGTALLSPHAFQGEFVHTFQPSPPTTTKGISVAALDWNPGGGASPALKIKFVSVHLDFSRRSVRRAQISEMESLLAKIEGPMVLMGDFNTDWQTDESSLKYLAELLDLQVFQPHAAGFSTYGDKGARLDWILISPELEFVNYTVVPDVVSDHYAVAADISLKKVDDQPRQLNGIQHEPEERQ